jgi:hypothetical protein
MESTVIVSYRWLVSGDHHERVEKRRFQERPASTWLIHRNASSGGFSFQATVVDLLSSHHTSMVPHGRLLYTAIAQLFPSFKAHDPNAGITGGFLHIVIGVAPLHQVPDLAQARFRGGLPGNAALM